MLLAYEGTASQLGGAEESRIGGGGKGGDQGGMNCQNGAVAIMIFSGSGPPTAKSGLVLCPSSSTFFFPPWGPAIAGVRRSLRPWIRLGQWMFERPA